MQAAIQQYAKQLHLPTIGRQFARLAEAGDEREAIASELSGSAAGSRVGGTGTQGHDAADSGGAIPEVKTLEEFDFQVAPHISAAQMRNLSEGGYLRARNRSFSLVKRGRGRRIWLPRWRWQRAGSASGCGSRRQRKWSPN